MQQMETWVDHFLSPADPEIAALTRREYERQRDGIELIASENYPSPAVRAAMASIFTAKYAEGYPGKRYYGGCEVVDEMENLARERLLRLFHADGWHANVQPHSGSQANMAVFAAALAPGDPVMGMSLEAGGHLTHANPQGLEGKLYNARQYGVNPETGLIDYDQVQRIALEHKPRLIVCGASAYPRMIDFARFRQIADSVGAYLLADIAHIAGPIAAGLHPSPIPYADFVTSTTHKTLRGPRGGLILCRAEHARAIDGRQAEDRLFQCHITVNKNTIPGETLKPSEASGIRIGSPSVTTRGMDERDMEEIADIIALALTQGASNDLRARVAALTANKPLHV